MQERRRTTRYDIAYPVEGDFVHKESLIDLSRGGAAFLSKDKIEVLEKVRLRVFLKNKMFILSGEVAHTTSSMDAGYKIGVRFIDVPDEFLDIFEKEIDEITQFHRETNLSKRKNATFREASIDFLENVFYERD